MNTSQQQLILKQFGAQAIFHYEVIQSLWSGYGEIVRLHLEGGSQLTVIAKMIALPQEVVHPRGWHTDFSHQRKIRSYEVEMHWYQRYASKCDESCRIARCFHASGDEQASLILLEDLDAAGFSLRKSHLNLQQAKGCLTWLANFHATFMGDATEGLWSVGSYWHLDTRPDEYQVMDDGPLKRNAEVLDRLLNRCRFQTVIHGDAKVANFCFHQKDEAVAAVDFQYAGRGCGMRDVAYFIGSALTSDECFTWQNGLLDHYFSQIRNKLYALGKFIDMDTLELEWRQLYPVAWADFQRFLMGWMPTHKKINLYSEAMTTKALQSLE